MDLMLKEKFLTKDIDVSSFSFYCAGSHHWLHIKTTRGSFENNNNNSNKAMPGPR